MTRLAATGLPRVRALIGAGCGATGLVLLTALLVTVRDRLGLAEVALGRCQLHRRCEDFRAACAQAPITPKGDNAGPCTSEDDHTRAV
jgi:hypothetical protein